MMVVGVGGGAKRIKKKNPKTSLKLENICCSNFLTNLHEILAVPGEES